MLSDHGIEEHVRKHKIGIEPFDRNRLSPASYDLTLADTIGQVPLSDPWNQRGEIDCAKVEPGYTRPVTMDESGYLLAPNEFILASTVETIRVPNNLVARIEGKSSLGRIGLAVHITAGYVDPGFCGTVTLEIVNLLGRPIRLRPGMRIAQIAFALMHSMPYEGYASRGHYQGQRGPTESRYSMAVDAATRIKEEEVL